MTPTHAYIVVALAVTALFGAASAGGACTLKDTTIPSLPLTCNGKNADGTTATWTMKGSISYTGQPDYGRPGWYDIAPCNNNTNIMDSTLRLTNQCEITIRTQSNVKANCPAIDGELKLVYEQYPSPDYA
jgi:hypothetical protein